MAIISPSPLQHEIIVQVFMYSLGVITNSSPLFLLSVFLAGIIYLAVLAMVWPPCMLRAAEAQIKETETHGLTCLDALQVVVDGLSNHHRTLFHLSRIHRYLRIVYKLSRDSRQCLRDVEELRSDLERQIRALDHPAVPANSEDNAEAATLPHTSLPTNSVDAMV